jgi:8-oxo-dGTP pyrophosphatase MutT (NUDIX family)
MSTNRLPQTSAAISARTPGILIAIACALLAGLPLQGYAQDSPFRAAGVMPYTFVDEDPLFLVGGEYRSDCFGGGPGFCWSTFVGRRDPSESHPTETAVREFHEETRYAFSPAEGSTPDPGRLAGSEPLPTHKSGIYVYLLEVPYVEPEDIRNGRSGWANEKMDYCWVSLPELLDAVDSPPHQLPSHCGQSNQRLFDVFRNDMTGESEIRSSIEALAAE